MPADDADLRVRARRDDAVAEAPRNDTARVQVKLNEAGEFLRYAAKHNGRWQDLAWIKDQARELIQEAREINRNREPAAMADTTADRAARDDIRQRERAIWTEVERVGKALRAAEAQAERQSMTQADRDAAAKKPTQGMGA